MRRAGLIAGALGGAAAVTAALIVAYPARKGPRPAESVGLPAADTTGMQAPVAELIRQAREAVLADPASEEAWGRLGAVYDAHRLYGPAQACYERARRLDPAEFRWPYFEAIVRDHRGEPLDSTLALFEAAAEIRPDYAPLYAVRGDVLLRGGRLEAARRSFEEALRLAPRYFTAHRGLGQALLALGDAEAAVEHLERARQLMDGDRATYAILAQAHERLGHRRRAERFARRARELESLYNYIDVERQYVGALGASSSATINRARFHLRTGDYVAAVEDLKAVAELTPDDEWVHRTLAEAYTRLGRHELAREHLAKARRAAAE